MAAHVDVLETRADQSLIAVPHFVKHVSKRCLQYQLFILHKSQRYVSLSMKDSKLSTYYFLILPKHFSEREVCMPSEVALKE
jgi:hypothetical protein